MDDLLWLLGTGMTLCAAAAFGTFVLWYARTAWRDTPIGRHLMAFNGVLGIVILYALFAAFIEVPPAGRLWVRLIAWSAVAAVGWRQVYVAIKTQRDGEAGRIPSAPSKDDWSI